jgi:hypothetical protein
MGIWKQSSGTNLEYDNCSKQGTYLMKYHLKFHCKHYIIFGTDGRGACPWAVGPELGKERIMYSVS